MVVGILNETNMDRSYQVYGSLEEVKRIRDFQRQGSSQNSGPYGEVIVMPGGRGVSSSPSRGREDTSDDYNFILIRTRDVGTTKELSKELREMGFNAWSMADSLDGIETFSRTVQTVLGGIGAITLLVAALGITTNTMVMSIYERTREIGIIKAIGASFFHVRSLFLMEASLIGFFGGIFGLGLSYGLSAVINKVGVNFMQGAIGGPIGGPAEASISLIPPWLAVFALIFSIFIGLVSGLYPANRAIKLSPIVAIRNE